MKKLWKKQIVIWGKSKESVELASREAVEVAKEGAVASAPIYAYGITAVKVDPDQDAQSVPELEDVFNEPA